MNEASALHRRYLEDGHLQSLEVQGAVSPVIISGNGLTEQMVNEQLVQYITGSHILTNASDFSLYADYPIDEYAAIYDLLVKKEGNINQLQPGVIILNFTRKEELLDHLELLLDSNPLLNPIYIIAHREELKPEILQEFLNYQLHFNTLTYKGLTSEEFCKLLEINLKNAYRNIELVIKMQEELSKQNSHEDSKSIKLPGKGTVKINPRLLIDIDERDILITKNDGQRQKANLSTQEYNLLKFLVEGNGQVFSRDELYDAIWKYEGCAGSGNLVEVAIRRLRVKIEEDSSQPTHILTVRGAGYRFIANSSSKKD